MADRDPDLLAAARATDRALRETYEALSRPYKRPCVFCRQNIIDVSHPESDGMCESCLERLYPGEDEK